MKIGAARRLKAQRIQVRAREELFREGGFNLSLGANTFKMRSEEDAYHTAAAFITKLKHDGFKFVRNAPESKKLDVFRKGSQEIALGVRGGHLMLDYWE